MLILMIPDITAKENQMDKDITTIIPQRNHIPQ